MGATRVALGGQSGQEMRSMRAGRGDQGGSEWCARRVRRGYRGSRQAGDAVQGEWRVGGVDRGGPWEGNGSGRGRRSGGSGQAVEAGRKRRWGQAGRVDGKVVGPGCVSLYHQSAWVRTGKPGDHKGTGGRRPGSGLPVQLRARMPPVHMGPHGQARGTQRVWGRDRALSAEARCSRRPEQGRPRLGSGDWRSRRGRLASVEDRGRRPCGGGQAPGRG